MTHPQPIFWLNANGTFFVGDGDGVQAFTSDASEVHDAMVAAYKAVDEYWNGDRVAAEKWLLKAREANKEPAK